MPRASGDCWVAHWRDPDGLQHKRVLARVWIDRGPPRDGYLTKRGARLALDDILLEERRRLPGSAFRARAPVTSEEASADWLRYTRDDRGRRNSTVRDYERVLRNTLLPAFGSVAIDALTAHDIDRFRSALVAERRLSARTINKYLAQLHSIFRRAQRDYGLAGNPAAGAERQPLRWSGDFDVLTVDEIGARAQAASSELDGAIFLTAAFAGLRLGELRALRWCDLDFAKRLVHVRRSDVLREAGPPKSGRVRSVPMVDDLADVLTELRSRERFTDEDDFVFADPLGGPVRGSSAAPAVLRGTRASAIEARALSRPPAQLRDARRAGIPALGREGVHGTRRHRDNDDLPASRAAARRRASSRISVAPGAH